MPDDKLLLASRITRTVRLAVSTKCLRPANDTLTPRPSVLSGPRCHGCLVQARVRRRSVLRRRLPMILQRVPRRIGSGRIHLYSQPPHDNVAGALFTTVEFAPGPRWAARPSATDGSPLQERNSRIRHMALPHVPCTRPSTHRAFRNRGLLRCLRKLARYFDDVTSN